MFRKIFYDLWLCSWKYHRKHIFYLLLIFSVAKRIYNIIHSSIQKYKQNPEKKSSNPVTFSHIFSVAKQQKHKHSGQIQKHKHFLGLTRGCNCAKHRADRDRRGASRDLGDLDRWFWRMISAISADDLADWNFGWSRQARLSLWCNQSFGRSLYFRG